MGLAFHNIYCPDGMNFNTADRVYMGTVDVVYASGAGGATVTATVTWTEPVPTPYAVFVDLPEEGSGFATSRTALGFTLNVRPQRAGDSLVGGTAICLVVA